MCTINLAMRKDEMPDKKINQYMDVVTWNTWLNNHDGEGYIGWNSRNLVSDRSADKIVYSDLKPFHKLITHQRFTTSGYGVNNVHPHEGKHFMLQHNGIFSGLGDSEKSDTKYYLEKLEKSFEKTRDVLKTIKDVNKDTAGSYSIVLYHKDTGKLYYYKSGSTSMYLLETSKFLFMSTKESSLEYAGVMFGVRANPKAVKSHRVYEITNSGLRKLGGFETKATTIYANYPTAASGYFAKVDAIVNKSEKKKGEKQTLFDDAGKVWDLDKEKDDDDVSPDDFYYMDGR